METINRETINFFSRYKSRKLTAKEYIEYTKKIFLVLKSLDPIFDNLYGWGTSVNDWALCDPTSQDFENIILTQIEDKELAYINTNENDKKLNLDSFSHIGYANSYSNTKKEDEGRITVKISDGEGKGFGFVNIKFPKIYYSQFYSKIFCDKLLKKCLNIIPIQYATILPENLMNKIPQIEKKYWIGWITYFHYIINNLESSLQTEYNNDSTIFYLSTDKYTQTTTKEIREALGLREKIINNENAMFFLKNILK